MSDNRTPAAPNVAHIARVWNYWLGGKDNYAIDREIGDWVTEMCPDIGDMVRADRAFLARAVRYLAGEVGIRQFLDIGAGLPTAENTHEIAQKIAPESRIVYVDNDHLVLVHAYGLISCPEGATAYVNADVHDPDTILEAAARTLDFTQPVALLLLGILNFVPDTQAAEAIVSRLLDAVPAGSYLVLSHSTLEFCGEANLEAMRFWNENATPPSTSRGRAEVARFFNGLEILEPGIVSCSRWRSEATQEPKEVAQFGVMGRKR